MNIYFFFFQILYNYIFFFLLLRLVYVLGEHITENLVLFFFVFVFLCVCFCFVLFLITPSTPIELFFCFNIACIYFCFKEKFLWRVAMLISAKARKKKKKKKNHKSMTVLLHEWRFITRISYYFIIWCLEKQKTKTSKIKKKKNILPNG